MCLYLIRIIYIYIYIYLSAYVIIVVGQIMYKNPIVVDEILIAVPSERSDDRLRSWPITAVP
jgi:hypothetical protein